MCYEINNEKIAAPKTNGATHNPAFFSHNLKDYGKLFLEKNKSKVKAPLCDKSCLRVENIASKLPMC